MQGFRRRNQKTEPESSDAGVEMELNAERILAEPLAAQNGSAHSIVIDAPLAAVMDGRFQPRLGPLTRSDVADLMPSMEANGQTSPIVVEPAPEEGEGKYCIIAGHRRCAALRFLGRTTVKAIVRHDLDERLARKLTLADNLGREDLSAFEQAKALSDFCDAFGQTIEAAGEELGIKPRTAFRLKGILSAPEPLQFAIREHGISAKAADLLCRIAKRWPKKAVRLAEKFSAGKATLKTLEAEARTGRSRGARKGAEAQDVVVKAEPHLLTLKLQLKTEERTDEQLVRVREAIAQVLGHLGIANVVASPVDAHDADHDDATDDERVVA